MESLSRRIKSAVGVTILEATIVLSMLSLLTAVLVPEATNFVVTGREVKALSDVRVLAVTLSRLSDDVVSFAEKPGGWATFDLLVSDGDPPKVGPQGDATWALPSTDPRVGSLYRHLVRDGPPYERLPDRLGSPAGWRGPYLGPGLTADPWGYRYAVNAQWLHTRGTGFGTIVLSTGPNGMAEVPFGSMGIGATGDDIIALISGGR